MEDARKHEHPGTPPHGPLQCANPTAVIELLDEWMRGDEAEQRETFEALRSGLDEDRAESYKLFP